MQQPTSQTNCSQHTDDTSTWVDLGPVGDFPVDAQVCTSAAGKSLVVFNIEGAFHVIANVCPHAGLPLGDGDRHGEIITCPYHGYTYHIKTGRNVDWPHDEPPVKTYPVRVLEGALQVRLEGERQPRKDDDDTKRGPAPADTPGDEGGECEPGRKEGDGPTEPECPEGYPDRKPRGDRPE